VAVPTPDRRTEASFARSKSSARRGSLADGQTWLRHHGHQLLLPPRLGALLRQLASRPAPATTLTRLAGPPLCTRAERSISSRSAGGRPGCDRRGSAGITGPGRPAQSGPSAGARLLLAQGDLAGAARWTQENGLTPACPQGYVRVFADEGAPMAALLGRLIAVQWAGEAAAKVPLGCLARLQRAFEASHATPDPLTARRSWSCGTFVPPAFGGRFHLARPLPGDASRSARS
jgi:hypothetical protein